VDWHWGVILPNSEVFLQLAKKRGLATSRNQTLDEDRFGIQVDCEVAAGRISTGVF
jgi:hypothetical protein